MEGFFLKFFLFLSSYLLFILHPNLYIQVSIVDKEISVLVKKLINTRSDILDNCIIKLEEFLSKYYEHFLAMHHYGNHVKKDMPDVRFVIEFEAAWWSKYLGSFFMPLFVGLCNFDFWNLKKKIFSYQLARTIHPRRESFSNCSSSTELMYAIICFLKFWNVYLRLF